MTQPSFACPRCGYATFLPSDVNAGYCPQCRWWTGDSLLGSEDVLAQAEIDGPFNPLIGTGWCDIVTDAQPPEINGNGSGEALPEAIYCAEHDLYDCWYAHDPTRAEVETDWFGMPVTVADCTERPEPTFRVARFVHALRRFRRP